MASKTLFDLISAIRTEFGVRTGRNEWLNIATAGHLHEHLCGVLGARAAEAQAALWARLVDFLARETGVAAERIRPDSGFSRDLGLAFR